MPFDNFFSARHKGKWKESIKTGAVHKRSWPKRSQFGQKVSLEMLPGPRGVEGWWPFLWVNEGEAEEELASWRKNNPGTRFRIGEA
jgi:hypothetical protein